MAAAHNSTPAGDLVCRREIHGMRTAWNFALELDIFAQRYRGDPVRMVEAINETIRQAVSVATRAGRLHRQHFLVWRNSGALWRNEAFEHRSIINTKVTSSRHAIGVVDNLHQGFQGLAGYLGVFPGGNPIGEGAVPLFWFGRGKLQLLSNAAKKRIEHHCALLYAQITLTQPAVLPNPYGDRIQRI
jgi:hypothetical protein